MLAATSVEAIVPKVKAFVQAVGTIVQGVVFLRFRASSLLKLTMPEGRLIVWNLGFGAWNFPRRGRDRGS